MFTVRAKNRHGARDLSRRNAGPADPRWEIAMPFRQPTFRRTKVRAPIAVPGETPLRIVSKTHGRDAQCHYRLGWLQLSLRARKKLRLFVLVAVSNSSVMSAKFVTVSNQVQADRSADFSIAYSPPGSESKRNWKSPAAAGSSAVSNGGG